MTPPALDSSDLVARGDAVLLPTYGPRPRAFLSGEGAWLVDDQGRRHLDFLCGLAVTGLGHAHPDVTAAVADQAARLVHTSNLFATAPQVALAERLRDLAGWPDGRVFLCSSGAEANEAALKIARRHGRAASPEKVRVVALEGGFHGRTLGALATTWSPAKREPFEPLGDWVTFVDPEDPGALGAAVDERTCAVIAEPVQGEGGVRPVPDATWEAARQACDRVGALLVADDVQAGVGRLGAWYGWQTTGVVPDVATLAKGLGNGLPIGAVVARGDAATALRPGDHGTTFGGGPVQCAAALAVCEVIERDGLVARATDAGERLSSALLALRDDHPLVTGVRGRGLLLAVELAAPLAGDVAVAALERGLVVNAVSATAVRLAPPLVVTDDEIDEAVTRLSAALRDVDAPSEGETRS